MLGGDRGDGGGKLLIDSLTSMARLESEEAGIEISTPRKLMPSSSAVLAIL